MVGFKSKLNELATDKNKLLLVLLVFSLPFDKTPSFQLYNVTIKPSLLIGLLVIFRAYFLLLTKKIKFKNDIFYKLLIFFVVWMAVLLPEAINIKRAVEFVVFNTYVISLAISVSLLFKKEYSKAVVYTILSSAVVVSIFGIIQYFADIYNVPNDLVGLSILYTKKTFGFPRISSFLLEPLYLASYMILPFSLSTVLFIAKKQLLNKRPLAILIVFFSLILFLTLSRGGIYGSLLALLFISIVGIVQKKASLRSIAISVALVLIGFVLSQSIITCFHVDPSEYTYGRRGTNAYANHIVDPELNPAEERTAARNFAIKTLYKQPSLLVLGVGPAQYAPFATNNKGLSDGRWPSLNNLTISLLFELGIIGLLVIVLYFANLVYGAIKKSTILKDQYSDILLISIAGYFVGQTLSYQTYSTLYIAHIWVCAGIVMGIINKRDKTAIHKI